jgi:hypothetical protein
LNKFGACVHWARQWKRVTLSGFANKKLNKTKAGISPP